MNTAACIDKPVSWLALEQYHLNELPEGDSMRVAGHLARCRQCNESLQSIIDDTYELPPLPEIEPRLQDSILSFVRRQFSAVQTSPVAAASMAVAIVAAIVLATAMPAFLKNHVPVSAADNVKIPAGSITFKGGELAVLLTRQSNGKIVQNPAAYKDGDRLSIKLTCPGPGATNWDVVVFQNNQAFFPFSKRNPIPCGNGRPLPGAFKIAGGGSATICVIIDNLPDNLPDRADIKTNGIRALPPGTVCQTIEYLPPIEN